MIDIVIQGKADEYTARTALSYSEISFVHKVVISCWLGDNLSNLNDSKISILYNKDIDNPGIGNRNRQIFSSFSGIKETSSDIVLKIRSDQKIHRDTLEKIIDYFYKNYQENQIFTRTYFSKFPFHPNDHIFLGYRKNLLELFDIPFDPNPSNNSKDEYQYNFFTRAETYIASYYYARFYPEVYTFIQNPREYLVDNAPNFSKSWTFSNKLKGQVFHTFPKIPIEWPIYGYKNDLSYYRNGSDKSYGECWND